MQRYLAFSEEAFMAHLKTAISLLLALLLTTMIGGCTSLVKKLNPDPPKVMLVGIDPVKMEVLQQTFKLTLNVQNPNDFDLPIRGIQFSAKINDDDFASGVSNQLVNIPALGEANLEVNVRSGLMQIINNLSKLGNAKSLDYSLQGNIRVQGIPVKIPFKETGTLTR